MKMKAFIVVLLVVCLATSAATAATEIAGDRLVARFALNEGSGSSVTDTSSNYDGTIYDTATWIAGKDGAALEFNPLSTDTTGRVEVLYDTGTPTDYDMSDPHGVSLTCWVKNYGQTAYGRLWHTYNGHNCFELETNDHPAYWWPGTGDIISSLTVPQDGQWHFLAMVLGETTVFTRVDDQTETLASSHNFSAGDWTDTEGWFGGVPDGGKEGWAGFVRPLHGAMDDVRLFNGILTEQEIEAIKSDYVHSPYSAHTPNPESSTVGVDPALTQISWTNPEPRQVSDTITVDVYFGTDPTPTSKIVDKQPVELAAVSLVEGNSYYWKVDCYDPNGPGPDILTEGAIWNFSTLGPAAWDPDPEDEETGVSIYTTMLGWQAGLGATSHEVYVSTDETAVTNRTAPMTVETTTSHDPGPLQLDSDHFWAVDEVNVGGTEPGPVWKFTTTDYEIIEPFGYLTYQELRTDWVGSPINDPNSHEPSPSGSGWAIFRYLDTSQTYTRTYTEDLDMSMAQRMVVPYQHEDPNSLVTLKLLNASDVVLLSSTLTDFEVSQEGAWNINLMTAGGDLSTVRKIVLEMPGFTTNPPADPTYYGFFVGHIAIATPYCAEPSDVDINGDCLITLDDFAEFAAEWLGCGIFPQEACP